MSFSNKLDEAGELFIQNFEGFSEKPYLDEHKVWTIGYGHIQGVTENSPSITRDEAESLFQQDLTPTERLVNKIVTVPLNRNEYTAIVSFAFNEGSRKLLTSTLLLKLNRGDRRGAAKEFIRWVYYENPDTKEMLVSSGLKKRRQKEMELFLTPSSDRVGHIVENLSHLSD